MGKLWLFHIPQNDWTDTLERLTSWLSAYGVAVALLGNSNAEVIALPREFFDRNIDLSPAVQEFKVRRNGFEIRMHTLNCEVMIDDLEATCTLTRVFLSDYPD
jgi:hypothetical protein